MQNLFLEDKTTRLFIFTNSNIIILSIEDEREYIISVQFFRKEEVVNFKYKKKYYDKKYEILFTLNQVEYLLNPKMDTNSYHVYDYNEIIEDIIYYFIN